MRPNFFIQANNNNNNNNNNNKRRLFRLYWTKSELAELDCRTRNLLTIHGALHPRSNVSRLYLPRREGGRGIISVKDAINIEERNINVYVC